MKTTSSNKQAARSFNVLVVADAGASADYCSEPRYTLSVTLDFVPNRRSSARQLETLITRIGWQLPAGTPKDGFHAWVLDEAGVPYLFVTGLFAVRNGDKAKTDVDSLNRILVPQVTCEQMKYTLTLLASADIDVWSFDYDEEELEDEEFDIESEVLHCACGDFDHSEIMDSDLDGHVYLSVTVWQKFELIVPFAPKGKLLLSQQRYLHALVEELVADKIYSDYDSEILSVELWRTTEGDETFGYLTGMLKVLEGRLSNRKLKAATEFARRSIPSELLVDYQAA